MANLKGDSQSQLPGVLGENTATGAGIEGRSEKGIGIVGKSSDGTGVKGSSESGSGIVAESVFAEAVRGMSHGSLAGLVGLNDASGPDAGQGVYAESQNGAGVRAVSHGSNAAIVGVNDSGSFSDAGEGVYGESQHGAGVRGISHTVVSKDENASDVGEHAGVVADSPRGIGLIAKGGGLAALFAGGVYVEGYVSVKDDILGRAFKTLHGDCAEDFNIGVGTKVAPGTVMVVGEDGALVPCHTAYDKRVVGVVSGAGGYSPGIVLDSRQSVEPGVTRQAIGLLGKVYCWADAQYGAIETGDMLTTSPTVGQAMKGLDPQQAFGSVIGKALGSLTEGQGLIPILVTLQ